AVSALAHPLQPVRFSGAHRWCHSFRMTTFLSKEMVDRAEASTPGCGCCIPPPDTVDKRVAELQARRDRLEATLRRLRTGPVGPAGT
ncbi:MAG: hypothetical protein M3326_06055, partial [Actinomycetota bacterium]|nr:hypothetical protein [Actinomycetota bacterium]